MRAWFPALLVATALTVTACDQQPTAPNGPLQLSVVSGDEQNGEPGAELADPLVVQVEDSRGHTISGQIVNFRVVEGGGSVFAGVAITNKVGIAQERWTLGLSGPQTVEARAVDPDTGAPLTFAVFTATLVDNQPPEVSDVVATPNPAQTTDPVTLSAHVADASNITGAEYSINGGEYLPMAAADGSFDSPSEDVQANLGPPGSAGDRNLCVRATDARGNTSGDVCVMITVNAPPQEIFVAIGSGNDSNPGTMQAPKATIGAGIEAAVAQGYARVNIAQGNYSEKVTLHTGIGLYGGYEASGWTRNAAVHITTIGGTTAGQPAVIGTSVSNVTLDGLVVSGPAATASAPNSYGLLLRNATNITINGSRIIASDGFGGSPGYVGSNGASGGSGGNGVPGDPDGIAGQGGTAGVGYCVNSNGGHGGAGGPEGANSGQAGENGHGSSPGLGGIGGAGGDPGSAGSNGGNGGNVGVLGSPGVGGLAFGSLTTGGLYQPALGGTASNGSPGSGGGGGGGGGGQGGLFLNDGGGNGGGGGGGGGCGGTGGTGGSGGGGSFALVLYQSSGIAITGSEITAGNGGLGGSGGVGGKGGAGGPGGAGPKLHSDEIGAGGDGGHGGYGGDGGIGGGGGGGPSIGILRVGPDAPSIPDLGAGTTISVGAGGYGGGGGSTGATGLAEQIHVIS